MPPRLSLDKDTMVKVLGGAVRNLFDIEADDPDDFTRDIAEGLYEALRAAAAENPQKSRSGPSGWAKFKRREEEQEGEAGRDSSEACHSFADCW